MIAIALSVIFLGLFLVAFGIWLIFQIPDPPVRDWDHPKVCSAFKCEIAQK